MKLFLTMITMLVLGDSLSAQTEPPISDTETVPVDSTVAKSTFTVGVSYSNNASYYGQRSLEKTPYIAAVGVYQHKSGFYLTGMAYRLLKDSATFASAYSAGAGFNFSISEHLKADVSYSYSFFPNLSPFLQAANPHTANLTVTHSGWLTTSLGFDYTFGKTNDVFATGGISKELTLFSPGEKDVVSFTPAFEVTAGTQKFYEYYLEEKHTRDSVLGLPLLPIIPGSGNTTTTTTTKTKTRVDLLSYNLKLPLAYSRAHYTLELACQFALLGDKAETRPGKINSFYGASFYYQF